MTDVSRETICVNVAAQLERCQSKGQRKYVRHGGTLCSKCYSAPPAGKNQRYCKKCHCDASKATKDRAIQAKAGGA